MSRYGGVEARSVASVFLQVWKEQRQAVPIFVGIKYKTHGWRQWTAINVPNLEAKNCFSYMTIQLWFHLSVNKCFQNHDRWRMMQGSHVLYHAKELLNTVRVRKRGKAKSVKKNKTDRVRKSMCVGVWDTEMRNHEAVHPRGNAAPIV